MVTSAGVDVGTPVPATQITAEQWDRLIAINLTGTFTCIQAAIPDMQTAGGAASSRSPRPAPSPVRERAHYVASKGGVIALTKALAYELSPQGITVNTIPPSIVDTPMAQAGVQAGTVRLTFWRPWFPCAAAEHPKTSPPPPPSCAPTTPAHHRSSHRCQRRHVHLNAKERFVELTAKCRDVARGSELFGYSRIQSGEGRGHVLQSVREVTLTGMLLCRGVR